MAARDSGVGGQTMGPFFAGGARTRRSVVPSAAAARGAWMARMTSVARSHLPHSSQSTPPARLRRRSSTAFEPAQIGQTNGMRTATGEGVAVGTT